MTAIPRIVLAIIAFFALTAFGSGERVFAPSADLWERWTAHDAASEATIDHSEWDRFLKDFVEPRDNGVNRVNYAGVDEAARGRLDGYIDRLSNTTISEFSRGEQLAYWINLYNAVTVQVVLDHYPVDSIQDIDISPGIFSSGPWGKKVVTVEGIDLTLNDIEHRILRPIWNDPRIHYAVNCASIGCPDLRPEAFTAAAIEETLTQAARDYINSPRGVSVQDGNVTVSRIYDWFIEDFGGSERGILEHVRTYAGARLLKDLDGISELDDTVYDWSLNDTTKSSG